MKLFFVAFTVLLLLSPLPTLWGQLSPTALPIQRFEHFVTLTSTGHILVNASITFENTVASPVSQPSFQVAYPKLYGEKMVGRLYLQGPNYEVKVDAEASRLRNSTLINVNPSPGSQIPAFGRANYTFWFYLEGAVSKKGSSLLLPFARPRASHQILNLTSLLILPEGVKAVQPSPFQEELRVGPSVRLRNMSRGLAPSTPSLVNVELSVEAASPFAILKFPSLIRTLIVTAEGGLMVRDSLEIVNVGNRGLKALRLSFLNPQVREFSVIPPLAPLAGYTVHPFLTDGRLNLTRWLNLVLEPGERRVLTYEYPLNPQSYSATASSLDVQLGLQPPVEGLVRTVSLDLSLPDGFAATLLGEGQSKESPRIVVHNLTRFDRDVVKIRVIPGFAAASAAVPVGTLVFLSALVLSALLLPRRRLEGLRGAVEGVLGVVREKLALSDELLALYEERRLGKIGHREFDGKRMDRLGRRSNASARLGELRASMAARFPNLQADLAELANVDREYEKAFRELLGLSDQLLGGRMKPETFDRQTPGIQRRLERFRGEILAALERLERLASGAGL